MDFVFTVCGDAAGETCPIWPGHPMTAHWGIEDPSHVQGPTIERERAFVTALRYLENRIKLFIALPFDRLDALALRSEENTSELQSLMRISYAVFCLKQKKQKRQQPEQTETNNKDISTMYSS